jgi:hypothetical protein
MVNAGKTLTQYSLHQVMHVRQTIWMWLWVPRKRWCEIPGLSISASDPTWISMVVIVMKIFLII